MVDNCYAHNLLMNFINIYTILNLLNDVLSGSHKHSITIKFIFAIKHQLGVIFRRLLKTTEILNPTLIIFTIYGYHPITIHVLLLLLNLI